MKLTVRTDNARRLGNGLIAHIRTVQAHMKEHGKPPQRPYLSYAQLIKETGAGTIPIGIGNFLEEIMVAIHTSGVPEAMRGLTLFVTDASGKIDYDKADWRDITTKNAMQFRKDVLAHDWTSAEFVVQEG